METIPLSALLVIGPDKLEAYYDTSFAARRHPDWQEFSREFRRKNPKCQACGSLAEVEAHHIRPVSYYPDLEMVEANLMSLCRVHHFTLGHLCDWRAWNPDAIDMVLVYQSFMGRRVYGLLEMRAV